MSVFRPTYTDKKTGKRIESAVWWYEFVYLGKRYRESAHTSRKTLASSREQNRKLELQQFMTTGRRPAEPAKMLRTVKEAVEAYMTSYDSPAHRPKSVAWVKERTPHLVRILGQSALMDIDEKAVTSYMRVRREKKASNRTINMELLCLSRAIGRKWGDLWPEAKRLEESSDKGKALSAAEEGRILGAAQKSKSPYVEAAITVALGTAMRLGEIRSLQLNRIDLAAREIRVGLSKTAAGAGRMIPMGADVFRVVSKQVERLSAKFGRPKPDWYLFPFCDRTGPLDPLRPVTTLKTAWEAIRAKADVSCRFHDLRHTAATKLAESGVPEATMKALLGHMSREMVEHYSHVRGEAKRKAVKGLTLAKPIFVVPQVSPKVTPRRKAS